MFIISLFLSFFVFLILDYWSRVKWKDPEKKKEKKKERHHHKIIRDEERNIHERQTDTNKLISQHKSIIRPNLHENVDMFHEGNQPISSLLFKL